MTAGGAYLELEGLRVSYAGTPAVDGLDLAIDEGEFFTLLGPSGCGKTSTLRALAGFVTPSAGDIRIRRESVVDRRPFERDVGMVFQSLALFPHMTVFDNIAYGTRMRGWDRQAVDTRVRELLELIMLPEAGRRYPGQLSGGQQQRVALARALAPRPAVLLLDEPLGALDRKIREELQIQLTRIHREVGTTTILVTHDQREAMGMSDRIAVMDAGRIRQVGSPETLYERPADLFVADFLGVSNLIPVRVEAVDGTEATVRLDDGTQVRVTAASGDEGGPAPGTSAHLALRPEDLRLRAADDGDGVLTGHVVLRRYLGAVAEFHVERPDGSELRAQTRERHEAAAFAPGDAVRLDFDRDAARLLEG